MHPSKLHQSKLQTSTRSSSARSNRSQHEAVTKAAVPDDSAAILGALGRLIEETTANHSRKESVVQTADNKRKNADKRISHSEASHLAVVPSLQIGSEVQKIIPSPPSTLTQPHPPQATTVRPNDAQQHNSIPKLQFINPNAAATGHHVKQFYTEMSFLLHHTVASIAHTIGATKCVLLAPSAAAAAGQQRLMMHPSAIANNALENNPFNTSMNSLVYEGTPGAANIFTIDTTPLRPNKVGPGYEYRSKGISGGPVPSQHNAVPGVGGLQTASVVNNDLHAIAAWSSTGNRRPQSPSASIPLATQRANFLPHDFVARGDGASTASLAMKLNLVVNCGGSMEPIGTELFNDYRSTVGYRPPTAGSNSQGVAEQQASPRPFTASSKVVDESTLPATRKALNRSTLYVPIELDSRQVWGEVVSESLSSSPTTSTEVPSGPVAVLALIDKRSPTRHGSLGEDTVAEICDFSVQDESLALSCVRGTLAPLLLRCWNYSRLAKLAVGGAEGGATGPGPQQLMPVGNTHRVHTELGARVVQPPPAAGIDTGRLRSAFEEEYRPKLLGTDTRTRFVVDFAGRALLSYPADYTSAPSVTLPGVEQKEPQKDAEYEATLEQAANEKVSTLLSAPAYVPHAQPQQLKSYKEALISRVGMLPPKEGSLPLRQGFSMDGIEPLSVENVEERPDTATTALSTRIGSAGTLGASVTATERASPHTSRASPAVVGGSARIPLTIGSRAYDPQLAERYLQARTHNATADAGNGGGKSHPHGVHNRVFHGHQQRDLVRFKTLGSATAHQTTHLAILDVIGLQTPLVPLLDYVTRLEHVADSITAGMYSEHVAESARRETYLKGVLIRAARAEEQNTRLSARNEDLLRENVSKEREIAQLQDDLRAVVTAGSMPATVAVGPSSVRSAMITALLNGSAAAQSVAVELQAQKERSSGAIGGRTSRASATPTNIGRTSVFSVNNSPSTRPLPPHSPQSPAMAVEDQTSNPLRQPSLFHAAFNSSTTSLPSVGRRLSLASQPNGIAAQSNNSHRRSSILFTLDAKGTQPQRAKQASHRDLEHCPQSPSQAISHSFSGSIVSRSQSPLAAMEESSPAEKHRTDVDRLMDGFDRERQRLLDEIGL